MNEIVYNELSSVKWIPLEFYTPGHSFNFKKQPIHFNSGCFFNLYDLFFNFKDLSLNNKTGFILSDLKNNRDIFDETISNSPLTFNNQINDIQTPVALLIDNQFCLLEETSGVATVNSKKTFGITDTLTFKFSSSEIVSVQNQNNKFLSVSSTEIGTKVFFTDQSSELIQTFNYLLGPRDINLFITNSYYNSAIGINLENRPFLQIVQPTTLNDVSIKMRLISYNNFLTTNFRENVTDSFVSKYTINPLKFNKELELDMNSLKSSYVQNYLSQFSINTPQLGSSVYELNIHPLKNYQTSEYFYNNRSENQKTPPNRKYKHLFTGTNQNYGLNNVYLGFESDTKSIIFPGDQTTTFTYPLSAPTLFLADSKLSEDGATGGPLPFISDRIFILDQTLTPVPEHPFNENMKWMCSWLFKYENEEPLWMDRYYDSSIYNINDALSATFEFKSNNILFNFESLEDLPSFLELIPGQKYSYTHVGKDIYESHLNYLENYYTNLKSLHFQTWNSSPLTSVNQSELKGFLFSNSEFNYDPNSFFLDGSEHVSIPIIEKLLPDKKLSANIWVNVKDWKNPPTSQIFGNYYDGGFGLLHNSPDICPVFSLLVKDVSGNFIATHFNYLLENLSKQQFESLQTYSNVNLIIRLPDFGFWAFDTYHGKAFKFKSNGYLESQIYNIFPEYTDVNIISQVEINSKEELFVYSSSKQHIKKITPSGIVSNLTSSYLINLQSNSKRMEITSNDELVFSQSTVSVLDNFNNLWEVYGQNIYKNKKDLKETNPKISLYGPIHQLAFDSYNNLWISHAVDRVSKLTPDGSFEFSNLRMGKRTGMNETTEVQNLPVDQFRFIHFIKKPSVCNPSVIEDVAILIDTRDEEMFFIEQNGFLRNRLNLNAFVPDLDFLTNSFFCKGDITGFNYTRKFKNKANQNLTWKLKTISYNSAPEYISLNYDASLLSPGWHMFSLIFNGTTGLVEYYIDASLVDSAEIPQNSIISYSLRTPLLIGAFTHQNFILNDLLNIQDVFKFRGSIADLRMYNTDLSVQDLITIFYTTNPVNPERDFSLNWNMNTGPVNYIEGIEHWFKNQLPGHKSNYFNINIHNLSANNLAKSAIESAIKNNIHKLTPSHTYLNKILWK
jgi:hypothetical protein